jgi:ABC-2 type transport system ATP-binding protein
MTDDTLIEARGLYRYYGGLCAVRAVGLELRRGEVLGFLGPNGAGKTTTMQMLCGTLAPSAGEIRVNGLDLLAEPKKAKAQLGYLPEHPPLYRELTVDEFLLYCARIHRVPRAGLAAALARTKRRTGIESVGGRLIGNLSKGYQQRVGIAQAILHSPAVVVLDEPTVGLDPIQIREIRDLIGELRAEHGVILSTHILPEVQAVCDRVLIIHEGRVVLDDTLAHLTREHRLSGLRIALRRPPALAVLNAIPGVGAVERLGEERYRIRPVPDQDPSEGLVEQAALRRWGLYELVPETRSLEETFMQITCGEGPAGGEASA